MEFSYKWKPIVDLSPEASFSRTNDLAALIRVWREQRDKIANRGALSQLTERLERQMAIEGGIIERAYTLDRGITLLLIERGIDASLIPHHATNKDPGWVAGTIQDHLNAAEGVYDQIKSGRSLTVGFVKQLHGVLMRRQTHTEAVDQFGNPIRVEMLRGEYKRRPNSPRRTDGRVHEYCPPEHVATEMERLLDFHRAHTERHVPPEIEAAWLHHAFAQIHPFQDGNGRIARLLASYVFIRAEGFPLVLVDEEHRSRYIDALERADETGDLSALIELFTEVQRAALVQALGAARDTHVTLDVSAAVAAAAHAVASRQPPAQALAAANSTASALMDACQARLQRVEEELSDSFAKMPAFSFSVEHEGDQGEKRHYFRRQVNDVAKRLAYFANTGAFHDWARLLLRSDGHAVILISAHAVGRPHSGILAISACFFHRVRSEEVTEESGLEPICDSWFQVSYLDTAESLMPRFQAWLDGALARGLNLWRAGL